MKLPKAAKLFFKNEKQGNCENRTAHLVDRENGRQTAYFRFVTWLSRVQELAESAQKCDRTGKVIV